MFWPLLLSLLFTEGQAIAARLCWQILKLSSKIKVHNTLQHEEAGNYIQKNIFKEDLNIAMAFYKKELAKIQQAFLNYQGYDIGAVSALSAKATFFKHQLDNCYAMSKHLETDCVEIVEDKDWGDSDYDSDDDDDVEDDAEEEGEEVEEMEEGVTSLGRQHTLFGCYCLTKAAKVLLYRKTFCFFL